MERISQKTRFSKKKSFEEEELKISFTKTVLKSNG